MNIDKEIAEKIMGWVINEEWKNQPSYCDPIKATPGYTNGFVMWVSEFNPSTNIQQIFQYVIPRMKELGYPFFSLHNNPFLKYEKRWVSSFREFETGNYYEEYSITPEMAICLTALKTIGERNG